jgi:hypothetical protein
VLKRYKGNISTNPKLTMAVKKSMGFKLSDWYFNKTEYNAHVNEAEIIKRSPLLNLK